MAPQSAEAGAGSRFGAFRRRRRHIMADPREPADLPSEDPDIAEKGEKNRREMDDVPAHGTDPLHEGP
jgi:hypothetical protein